MFVSFSVEWRRRWLKGCSLFWISLHAPAQTTTRALRTRTPTMTRFQQQQSLVLRQFRAANPAYRQHSSTFDTAKPFSCHGVRIFSVEHPWHVHFWSTVSFALFHPDFNHGLAFSLSADQCTSSLPRVDLTMASRSECRY